MDAQRKYDVVVVGAGFGGISQLFEARRRGLSCLVLDAAKGVGGVWHWNRYPGARCDAESIDYSYSFSEEVQQEWTWSERYATQPELEAYINFVVDRLDLRDGIQLETRVVSAVWSDELAAWTLTTGDGEEIVGSNLVMATGQLHVSNTPSLPGAESFQGLSYHTAHWPEDADLTGKRVGVIGTGSSGVQVVPQVADLASELFVFQRTANFCVPAQQGPIPEVEMESIKKSYPEHRVHARQTFFGVSIPSTGRMVMDDSPEQQRIEFEKNWGYGGFAFLSTYLDLTVSKESNNVAADFVAEKIREIVKDPEVAALLTPTRDIHLGIKRIGIDNEYYATFNRPHVHLVDVRSAPIVGLTEKGLQTTEQVYELDVLIYATGFDAITGAINRIDIRGREGQSLRDHWSDGPTAYLGLMTAGFPNLFVIGGPNSPDALSNVPALVEAQARWLTDLIASSREEGLTVIEARQQAEEEWSQRVQDIANGTLYPTVDTWYNGSNIEGKPRVISTFLGGVNVYLDELEAIEAAGYPGFDRAAIDTLLTSLQN